jgi:hypothetical protein
MCRQLVLFITLQPVNELMSSEKIIRNLENEVDGQITEVQLYGWPSSFVRAFPYIARYCMMYSRVRKKSKLNLSYLYTHVTGHFDRKPKFIYEPRNVTVVEGQSISLYCLAYTDLPSITSWSRDYQTHGSNSSDEEDIRKQVCWFNELCSSFFRFFYSPWQIKTTRNRCHNSFISSPDTDSMQLVACQKA